MNENNINKNQNKITNTIAVNVMMNIQVTYTHMRPTKNNYEDEENINKRYFVFEDLWHTHINRLYGLYTTTSTHSPIAGNTKATESDRDRMNGEERS